MEPHKHIKPQKRRKGLWIALCVLLILAAGVVGVGIWQKNNLEAVKQYTQYTQEELEQQLQDNDKQVQDILNAALEAAKKVDSETGAAPEQQTPGNTAETPDAVVREPENPVTEPLPPANPSDTPVTPDTPPVNEAPKPETPPAPETPPVTETPQTPAPAPETPPVTETPVVPEPPAETGPTYEAQLQAIVDKVYTLREEYLIALDEMLEAAKADYKAIPKSQRTKKAIINFVSTYISKANALEKQCDGKMDALVKELTQLQKKYGQTMELVDAVKYTYANEKSLKKAWYMSELEKRGMI